MLSTRPDGVVPAQLRTMATTIRHRGPDDEGYLFVDWDGIATACWGDDTVAARNGGRHVRDAAGRYRVGLAHRRLSILDTSPAGHQPMVSADGTLWIAYNGEIYNYVELRRDLEARGRTFQSDTDTEVLLQAYQEWGEACLDRFNGMWAFALVDLRSGSLFCARDRLGVKPFYYWHDGETFLFASEIKALLAVPAVPRVANDRAIWDFLVLGAVDHTVETFYDGIHVLGAGMSLRVSFDGTRTLRRYWSPPTAPDGGAIDLPATIPRLRDLLFDSVRMRLRSDVSVGFCLSGGLDSSTIVSIADRLLDEEDRPQVGDRLKTFTFVTDDARIDERAYANAVVERCRVAASQVQPTGADLYADYARLLASQDEPFGGPSIYGQYRVAQLARDSGIRVLLDGQGSDELFGGYYHYYGAYFLRLVRSGRWAEALHALRTTGSISGRHALIQLALRALPRPLARQALLRMTTRRGLIDPSFLAEHRDRADAYLDDVRSARTINQLLARDLTRSSLPHLLRYEDRNSMAFSIESRVPFADDVALLEFVMALPSSAKVRGGWSKALLREATAGLIPDTIRWRKAKLGFSVPQRQWASEIPAALATDLIDAIPAGYLNRQALASLPAGHIDHMMLWRLVELGLWHEMLPRRAPVESGLVAAAS